MEVKVFLCLIAFLLASYFLINFIEDIWFYTPSYPAFIHNPLPCMSQTQQLSIPENKKTHSKWVAWISKTTIMSRVEKYKASLIACSSADWVFNPSIAMLKRIVNYKWSFKYKLHFKWYLISESEKSESVKSPVKIGDEISFKVRRSLFGRHGWIVMSADEAVDLKQLNDDVMRKLADKIRDLEFSGKDVPDQITVKVK